MRRPFVAALTLVLWGGLLVRADQVTGSAVIVVAPTAPFVFSARPDVATGPNGQSMIAWVENQAVTQTLRYTVLDAEGQVVVGGMVPQMFPGMLPVSARVAANPDGFMLVWEGTGGPETGTGPGGSAIWFQTFDFAGNPLSSPHLQANVLVDMDEGEPDVAGASSSYFALTWRRRPFGGTAATQGVYVRRFLIDGSPIDATEVRVDDAVLDYGSQTRPRIAAWPDFHAVVTWRDGPLGAAPSVTGSPDGHGGAVLARFLQPDLSPQTPSHTVCNTITADDQYLADVAVSNDDDCVVAWTSDVGNGGADVVFRRYGKLGTPRDPAEVATTTDLGEAAYLSSVCMTANGEFSLAWTDGAAWNGCTNTTGHPAWVARYADSGLLLERLNPEPATQTNDFAFPAVGSDQYGNLIVAYEACDAVGGGSLQLGVRARCYQRNMVVFSNPSPLPGSTLVIGVDSPSDPNRLFLLGASGFKGSIPIDYRNLALAPDVIFECSITGFCAGIFQNFMGFLDNAGLSIHPVMHLPNLPALSGFTLWFAFVTHDPAAPSSIHTVSPTAPLTIQ